MVANPVEPPELVNRDGEKIVVFRDGFGNFFSNHPDYPLALALHQQAEAAKAAAAQQDDVVEDEPVAPEDGNGVIDYEEMNSKDLVAEAKQRGLEIPSGTRRSQVIAMLQASDKAKAAE